jgi:hypothetical protein
MSARLLLAACAWACACVLAFLSGGPSSALAGEGQRAFGSYGGGAEGYPPPAAEPVSSSRAWAPAASEPARPAGHELVRVRAGRSVALRSAPGGAAVARLDSRTEFGSARVLSVMATRGHWIGVSTPLRPNGRLGWIDRRAKGLDFVRSELSLHADLSRRRVVLRRGSRVLRTLRVAIGRPGSSTPTGRFSVTDKLSGPRFSRYFGCCILALSGTQPKLPAGWDGGNRLAIHGTDRPSSIGRRASAGCLRAAEGPLRSLMRTVPVGTPVTIAR